MHEVDRTVQSTGGGVGTRVTFGLRWVSYHTGQFSTPIISALAEIHGDENICLVLTFIQYDLVAKHNHLEFGLGN